MNSKLAILIVLTLVTIVLLALFARKSVKAEVTIEASPEDVWAVLNDPTSYAEWNPILVAVEGTFEEGATMAVDMRNPDGSITAMTPRVRELVPGSKLNQFGGIPGVLTYDHTWSLESVDGGTRVVQFEEYRGIGVLFWNPASVEAAYNEANANLKAMFDYSTAEDSVRGGVEQPD